MKSKIQESLDKRSEKYIPDNKYNNRKYSLINESLETFSDIMKRGADGYMFIDEDVELRGMHKPQCD